eukprot:TRINITY_DN12228_c1_g1_i5.p3 TRINITY_DN12228_c1_g1~~TRINITY_DN12228_c1_g1_i5.p3  ORF type:complete len:115 (+),score=21.44 TRINITY_DN12228_c1_g1_i5:2035-2379(+)
MGVLIYELLTGREPFFGATDDAVFQRTLRGSVPYPPSLSKSARVLIRRLLTKDPRSRYGANRMQLQKQTFFEDVDWDALSRGVVSKRGSILYLHLIISPLTHSVTSARMSGTFC